VKKLVNIAFLVCLACLFFICTHDISYAQDVTVKDTTAKETAAKEAAAQDTATSAVAQDKAATASIQDAAAAQDPASVLGTAYGPVAPDAAAAQDAAAEETAKGKPTSMVKMHGTYGLSMGFTMDEAMWKMANGDWQEKNWRYAFHDLDVNVYDPRIFDRYEVEIETDTKTPWNAYADIIIDPWSFVQVSNTQHVLNEVGDESVDVKYKAWQNTGYTINQMLRTDRGGTIFIPEQKVISNRVTQFTGDPVFAPTGTNPFIFSPDRNTKLEYIFRPVRKLWVEYNESPLYIKAFAIADQAEALTSDDPLTLSNNHVYWAPSPWLWRFDPGREFTQLPGLSEVAQQPAMWNWDEQWFAEDSNRRYLTFLRGISAGWNVEDFASLNITAAAPLGLWDTYETVTSVPIAARFKMNPTDKLTLGSTYTSKYGVFKQHLRAQNHVLAGDVTYNVWDKTDVFGELAGSLMNVEHADREITKDTGEAYKLGVRSKIDFNEANSLKSDVYFAYMSQNFSPGLADYRDTREDREWGRHIWFEPLSPEDQASRIGDGVDINRYTVGANARAKIADNFFDVFLNFRNVHDATESNKFVENTARAEVTCNPVGRVQLKGLALVRNYHDSIGGYDPLIRERYTDKFYQSLSSGGTLSTVEDGQDVNIMTFSGGAKVDVVPDKVIVYGVYEATNDPQDFPRNILNNPTPNNSDGTPANYTHDNVNFNQLNYSLYTQSLFNLPPYNDFFSMWKGCVTVRPVKNFQVKYTHVTNTNQNYAALFDNNHTHDEVTVVYNPFKGVTWTTGCSISRVIDLARAVDTSAGPGGISVSPQDRQFKSHTNIYSQLNWDFKRDQRLTFQFGESWFLTQGGDVFGPRWFSQTTSVLDTRAIFRVWYQGKF